MTTGSRERRGTDGERPRLVLVAGVGRSGTSLFTTLLSTAGFHVPQPEVTADSTNPKGFGEPAWVVDFHGRLLRARRVSVWDSRPAAWEQTSAAVDDRAALDELRSWLKVQLVGRSAVVVKDPRIGWFLPLWERAAEEVGADVSFASMLRHPAEAVGSAMTWYGDWQSPASRAVSWVNIMLETEYATRGRRRVFVRYDDLLKSWRDEVARAADALDLPQLRDLPPETAAAIDELVDPSLHRQREGFADLGVPPLVRQVAEPVWEELVALTEPGEGGAEVRSALDASRAAYHAFYADVEAIAQSSLHALRPESSAGAAATSRVSRPGNRPAAGGGGADAVIRLAERFVPRRLLRKVPPVWRARLVRVADRAGRLVRR
jgi:hypothetical protein